MFERPNTPDELYHYKQLITQARAMGEQDVTSLLEQERRTREEMKSATEQRAPALVHAA